MAHYMSRRICSFARRQDLVDDVLVLERHRRGVLHTDARGRGGLDHDADHTADAEGGPLDLERPVGKPVQGIVDGRVLAQHRDAEERPAPMDSQGRTRYAATGLAATPKSAAFSRKNGRPGFAVVGREAGQGGQGQTELEVAGQAVHVVATSEG